MDHKNQLDTSIYIIETVEMTDDEGTHRYTKTSFCAGHPKLEKMISRHNTGDKDTINTKINNLEDGVYFDGFCARTGHDPYVHNHMMTVLVIKDGKMISETVHTPHNNGEVSDFYYDPFLVSKISYFENVCPELNINIHNSLSSKEQFHDDNNCLFNYDND